MSERTDRELMALALDRLWSVTDEGPDYEGWKSPDLQALVDEIDRRVNRDITPNQGAHMIEDDELMDAARAFSRANVEVSLARTARERCYDEYMRANVRESHARGARNKALTALLAVGAHSVSE